MMRGKLALVCSCVLGLGSAAHAASLLDDSPTMLAAWDAPLGFVSVADNSFAPPSGAVTYRLLLSTGGNENGNAPAVGAVNGYVGASVDVGGHPGFDAGPAVEGSAVVRSFTASAGDVVTISYDFLTAEGSAELSVVLSPDEIAQLPPFYTDDFAFIAISHDGVTQVTRLADVLTPGLTDIFDASGERFAYHTGFRTLSLTLPSSVSGSYSIALGVMDGAGFVDVLGHIGESALLVESINLSPGVNPVPSPAAVSAGGVLLAGWASFRSLRRRR